MKIEDIHPASFRDRSGFIFTEGGQLYRQIQRSYQEEYELLVNSGLYETLTEQRFLIPHEEVEAPAGGSDDRYRVIKPQSIEFISYPYEWCFSQLKDAALLTLTIQNLALDHGMSLKDASAFNVQFHNGSPILIDTLSFEIYQPGQPWVAYRQFCQHFLAPLALMSLVDIRLQKLLTVYIDGIPIDLASNLLPPRTRINPGLLANIHLHAASQRRFSRRDVQIRPRAASMSMNAMRGLVDGLRRAVEKLRWEPSGTEWADYYAVTHNYEDEAMQHKVSIVSAMLDELDISEAWDLGANTGSFSRLATQKGIRTISFDVDPGAVEINYHQSLESGDDRCLPLLLDLTSPTPSVGWENRERAALLERGPADLVMALALVHHLAIGNNVPLTELASFFTRIGRYLMIEFVPKSDPQVQRMLALRRDIFDDYNQDTFEAAFGRHFIMLRKEPIQASDRTVYLFEKRSG